MESAKNFNLMQALKENAIYLVLLVLLMIAPGISFARAMTYPGNASWQA